MVGAGVLNQSALLASGSEAVLKRLQIAHKVEALVCRVDGSRKNTLKADLHAAVSAKDVNAAVTCLQSPGIKDVTKVIPSEWIQEQLRVLASQPAAVFTAQASFWTELLHCLTHGHSAGESFFGCDKTPKKPLPKAKKTGSRSGDRKAALDGLGDHMKRNSPIVKEGAARTIVKSKVGKARASRKKNPNPVVSIELDVEAKTNWKKRQLAIEDKNLAIKELRKRLKACGCSTAGSKDVLLKRYVH